MKIKENDINQSKYPNKETQKAIKEARSGKNVEKVTLDNLESEFNK